MQIDTQSSGTTKIDGLVGSGFEMLRGTSADPMGPTCPTASRDDGRREMQRLQELEAMISQMLKDAKARE